MSENVNLTLTGIQQDESGERDINTTNAVAEYYERNGSHYILFEEKDTDSSAVVKSTIKFKNNCLELTKKGHVTTRMVFAPEQEYMTDYITPFGSMQMGILTHSVECHFKKGLPQIRASYTLTSQGEPISQSIIIIKLAK